MRELAREHGIPIVENIPLARLLYRKVKVGRSVPAETFKAVAAILAFVYRALGRDGDRPAARPAERRRDRRGLAVNELEGNEQPDQRPGGDRRWRC